MSATRALSSAPVEILDLLWEADPVSGERLPVRRADVVARLHASAQFRAARLIARLPHRDGLLDEGAVDRVYLAVHYELARLSQVLHVPQRMAHTTKALVERVRERAGGGVVTVVDVGCGIGMDMRHMSHHQSLGAEVEYWGVDLNPLLVDVAQRLAADEGVDATFVVGDAFDAAQVVTHPARTVLISQGLMHHVGEDRLSRFFAHHHEVGVAAFAHFDVNPGFWSTYGGWVLHQVRMSNPVSRHDGTMSMTRALSAATLLAHAREGLSDAYDLDCDARRSLLPAPHRALRPITGVRR